MLPPKESLVEVRCLQDCGQIVTATGVLSLDKGSQHFVKRTDVETLIRNGSVEHIINQQL